LYWAVKISYTTLGFDLKFFERFPEETNVKNLLLPAVVLALALLQLGMARSGQYDEEAREAERLQKLSGKQTELPKERKNPLKGMASGVKQAAFDAPAELVADTAEGTIQEPPIVGTIDGAREGSGRAVDSAVKGVVKVATLGYVSPQKVDVEEPRADSNEYTKFKVNL
jgi:hypothetical protein